LDVLTEFEFEEVLDAKGVFDTLWVLEEDPQADTDILGLKLFVEVAEGQDDPATDPDRPGDTVINDVLE
jgi:hypothetical protein